MSVQTVNSNSYTVYAINTSSLPRTTIYAMVVCDSDKPLLSLPSTNDKLIIDVKEDFKRIKKLCKGVLPDSIFTVDLSSKYILNGKLTEEYVSLRKMCRDRNWQLIVIGRNKFSIIVLKLTDSVDTLVHNLKTCIRLCKTHLVGLIFSIQVDIDYDAVKYKLEKEHNLKITYIKRDEKLKETTFNIDKI